MALPPQYSNNRNVPAIFGENTAGGDGVFGKSATGVHAEGNTWHGVVGVSRDPNGAFGVYGTSTTGGPGVVGESTGWHAAAGFSSSTTGGAGVYGEHRQSGIAVLGNSPKARACMATVLPPACPAKRVRLRRVWQRCYRRCVRRKRQCKRRGWA